MFESLAIGLYCLFLVGLAILFLKFRNRLQSQRESRDYETLKRDYPERVYGTAEYFARFSHPDFAAIEAHLGRGLPEQFKRLYGDAPSVLATEFVVIPTQPEGIHENWPVNCFLPADQQAISDMWPDEFLNSAHVPFAADGCGGLYYLDLETGTEQDAPVWLYHYDGDIRMEVAESLGEFLGWRRATGSAIEKTDT